MYLFDRILSALRALAAGYEPARASAIAAAVFTLAAGLGLSVGDLPQKVDAVLVFLATVSVLIAGEATRKRVTPVKTLIQGPDGVYR